MRRAVVLRFGELFLKGQNRGFFEDRLLDHIRRLCARVPGAEVRKIHARVLVECPEASLPRLVTRMGYAFGVQSLSPVALVDKDFRAIAEAAVALVRETLARRGGGTPTFKVEARRSDKRFPLSSLDLNREIGAAVVEALSLPVDVHQPELTLGVEVGREATFVWADTVPGPGGLPVGASGRVNLLLSGGIDSPVAGWLAMKRGLKLAATYFHSFPYTGDKTKEKVLELARLLTPWQGSLPLYVVGFTDVQKTLRDAGPAELAVILYRRMMVRTAACIAERENALALVTGDNLGQVASQTLENLSVIQEASSLPILRPLLCNDKLETVALARRIGTYDVSVQPYDDCCSLFVPSHPATRARLASVQGAEAGLDVAALARQMAGSAERIVVAP